jgi:hypothetical protein
MRENNANFYQTLLCGDSYVPKRYYQPAIWIKLVKIGIVNAYLNCLSA